MDYKISKYDKHTLMRQAIKMVSIGSNWNTRWNFRYATIFFNMIEKYF